MASAVQQGFSQTREAVKWLAAAFGVVAGVLVAGSQLSDMGALEVWTARWWAAVGGLVVALVGALCAVIGTVWVLMPVQSTLSDAANDESFAKWLDDRPEMLPPDETSIERFRGRYMALYRAGQLPDSFRKWAQRLQAAAALHRFRRATAVAVSVMLIGGSVAAVGIAVFAWAAHPPKSDTATEADKSPVAVRLVLTSAGEELLRKASGCDPATTQAVRVGGTAATPEILVLPQNGCKAVRLTLSDSAGEAVEPG